MRKKIITTITLVLLLVFISVTVYAVTLNCFYSNEPEIGKMYYRTIFLKNFSGGFTNANAIAYKDYARNQWVGAGITTYAASSAASAKINWYCGTSPQLELLDPTVAYYSALTLDILINPSTTIYGGKTITTREVAFATIYTPTHSLWPGAKYKRAFTHELGHALGWLGHSEVSNSDVMYNAVGDTFITLTTRDKNHLKQMY